ncbi:MAG: DUF3341 domain-containing protein [Longimicrobiales bacterium]
MSSRAGGILGVFDGVDGAIDAVDRLRSAGLRRFTVFSPAPDHDLEHAIHAPQSPVRLFTLVGGLTGAATGFALPTWTSLDWPLVTGGKPTISIPAWVIIAFELTILFGALSTVLGLFITSRLPQRRPGLVYDTSFSADRYGVFIRAPGKESQVRSLFQSAGAVEIREHIEEVPVATA